MPGLDRPLSINLYDKATGSSEDIAAQVTNLQLTTVAPGGYGSMKAIMRVPEKRGNVVPPHLRPFAQVAIMDSNIPLFLGRLDEPGVALSNKTAEDGVYYDLSALGASAALSDDPQVTSYSLQTAKQIVTDQISGPSGSGTPRSVYLNIDQDTSLIFPSNPAAQFSPSYDGKTIADVLGELLPQVGDYTWSIVGHQRNRDVAGFPTWQLSCGVRDTSTIHYTGFLADEDSYLIRPAIDWSYNAIQLLYMDSTTQARGSVTVTDSRLAANRTQGTAPFPYRLLRQDQSNLLMSGAEAAVVANALLAQYMNGGYKIQVLLGRARDAQGNPIPLRQVTAGKNIFLPELIPLWQQLLSPSVVTNANLFFIQQADYQEYDGSQAPILTLTLNTFTDTAAFAIAALQARADAQTKSQATAGVFQTPGRPIIGVVSGAVPSTAPSGSTWEFPVTFPAQAVTAPSSVSIVSTVNTNLLSVSAQNITATGFSFRMVTNTTGSASRFVGSYSTVGN